MPKGVYERTNDMNIGKYKRTKDMKTGKYERTEEIRRKISESHKGINIGKPRSEETKIKISIGNKGKKRKPLSEETKNMISKTMKGHKAWNKNLTKENNQSIANMSLSQIGERNSNWKGGNSKRSTYFNYGLSAPEEDELRESIRKRDNYRCQQCFRHQDELFEKWKNGKVIKRKLDVHHIDFNKKNNNPNNLISLCNNCHNQTNFNRESWTKYFQERINGEVQNEI